MSNDVTLYALSTCIHCKHAKELLDAKGVDYDYTYVDKLEGDERKQMIEEVKKHNPNISFPTLLIGDFCIVGYKKDKIEEALEKVGA